LEPCGVMVEVSTG